MTNNIISAIIVTAKIYRSPDNIAIVRASQPRSRIALWYLLVDYFTVGRAGIEWRVHTYKIGGEESSSLPGNIYSASIILADSLNPEAGVDLTLSSVHCDIYIYTLQRAAA